MPRKKLDLKVKIIKITPQQQEMLDIFTDRWGYISETEVFRQALTFYYRKMEPEYLKPTPKQAEKQKELDIEKKMEEMSDERYALEVMRGKVMLSTDGNKYCIIMAIANNVKIIPLDTVKAFDKADEFYRTTHLSMLAKGVDFDEYITRCAFQLKQKGILV